MDDNLKELLAKVMTTPVKDLDKQDISRLAWSFRCEHDAKRADKATTVTVETNYDCYVPTEVELPEGKTAKDIEGIYMKWGSGEIEFTDGTTIEFDEDPSYYDPDAKRPNLIRAYPSHEDGTDYGNEVYSDG